MNNSPGQRPIGVLDLVFFWCWVLEVGMFTSPPPSQWALELLMLTPNGSRSTFEPSFCRFFGVSIFDLFFDSIFHRFWLPNGSKLEPKSIKNLTFSSIGAGSVFCRSQAASGAHVCINFGTCEPRFRSDPTALLFFFTFQKIASRATSE